MSQTPDLLAGGRSLTDLGSPWTVSDDERVRDLLDALTDEDCQTIIEATTDDALTAQELSESYDLAQSTTYRKLDRLTEAGLLEERVRIDPSGRHTKEYARAVEGVHVEIGADGIELEVTGCESELESVAPEPTAAD